MNDIPVFTTENGAASLFLREIPYTGIARVKIHASQTPKELLEECAAFCRACGADAVHASGHEWLEVFPLVTTVFEMRADVSGMDQTDAALFPVTNETVGKWRKLINERMAAVDNASYISEREEPKLLKRGDCYFIHGNGQLLGLGRASDDTIELAASMIPGAGKDVVMALSRLITSDYVKVTVSDTNIRAVNLYRRLGFVPVRQIAKWYKVF